MSLQTSVTPRSHQSHMLSGGFPEAQSCAAGASQPGCQGAGTLPCTCSTAPGQPGHTSACPPAFPLLVHGTPSFLTKSDTKSVWALARRFCAHKGRKSSTAWMWCCTPRTREAEAESQVRAYPGLHSKTLTLKIKNSFCPKGSPNMA